jgi:Flp pilus assembly pilin Flp
MKSADGSRLKRLRRWLRNDSGMTSAEYAVGTLAAVAFAGLLLKVVTSAPIQAALSHLIERALK